MGKPWGEIPGGVVEFSLQRENHTTGKFDTLMAPMPGGAEGTHIAIDLLSEAWVAQFGGGTYRLRWLRKAGIGSSRSGGYSPAFKMTGGLRMVEVTGSPEDGPAAAAAPVDVTTVLMAQMARDADRFEQRLMEERSRAENERAREREHYERLEAARMQGRVEVLEQLRTLHQISPPPPPPPPVSDAPPAWAAAIITRLDALEASFTDEEEEDGEEEEEEGEEAEDGLTLAEAAKLSPMQEYLVQQAEKFGPAILGFLEKNAPPGTVPASVARSVAGHENGAAASSSTRQSVPPSGGVVDTGASVS